MTKTGEGRVRKRTGIRWKTEIELLLSAACAAQNRIKFPKMASLRSPQVKYAKTASKKKKKKKKKKTHEFTDEFLGHFKAKNG